MTIPLLLGVQRADRAASPELTREQREHAINSRGFRKEVPGGESIVPAFTEAQWTYKPLIDVMECAEHILPAEGTPFARSQEALAESD